MSVRSSRFVPHSEQENLFVAEDGTPDIKAEKSSPTYLVSRESPLPARIIA